MNDAEKKMNKYCARVERRLNLPRDVKARVMTDFRSAIQARQEAGMTDEEIFAELGAPKKAAADLNEQMKEYAYRKSPWRFLFAACAAYGAAELLGVVWAYVWCYLVQAYYYFSPGEAAVIGVIGGADGPTSVFVTTPGWISYLIDILVMVIGIWGFLRLRKCKKK